MRAEEKQAQSEVGKKASEPVAHERLFKHTRLDNSRNTTVGIAMNGVPGWIVEAAPPGLLLGYCRLSERDASEGLRRIASLIRRARRRRRDNHPGDDELAVRVEQR